MSSGFDLFHPVHVLETDLPHELDGSKGYNINDCGFGKETDSQRIPSIPAPLHVTLPPDHPLSGLRGQPGEGPQGPGAPREGGADPPSSTLATPDPPGYVHSAPGSTQGTAHDRPADERTADSGAAWIRDRGDSSSDGQHTQ